MAYSGRSSNRNCQFANGHGNTGKVLQEPQRTETMADSQPQASLSFVDNTGSSSVDSFMCHEVVGARRVAVCVGYSSESGLERLADWLDRTSDGQRLLPLSLADFVRIPLSSPSRTSSGGGDFSSSRPILPRPMVAGHLNLPGKRRGGIGSA